MNGPGKYDDACTIVRESTAAEFVAVIVIGGNKGDGFSVQATDEVRLKKLPIVLRTMANDIEELSRSRFVLALLTPELPPRGEREQRP